MDAKRFLQEFGYIANASNGVLKLRELVLQFAISGKLVDRHEPTVTAVEEIDRAKELKIDYEKNHKIRKSKKKDVNIVIPFSIPDHWATVELDELALYIQRGKSPKYTSFGKCKVISQKCVQWAGFDMEPAKFVTDSSLGTYGKERYLVENDLLLNSTGTGTVGRINVISSLDSQFLVVADSHVTVIRLANANSRFIWCVLASPWAQARIDPDHIEAIVSGSTKQVELNTSTVKGLPIPFPPVEEQTRIVEKVDELMVLCDQLEQQQQKKRKLQNQLRKATLDAVATATSPFELKQHWQRLEANFQNLFSQPEDVEELRLTVKELAIQGKLSQSEITDSDVDRMLEVVSSEIETLKNEGEIKTRKNSAPIDYAQAPFEIPKHWRWKRFPELGVFGRGKSKHRPRNDPKLFTPGVYPLVQTGEVARSTRYITEVHSRYSEFGLNQSKLWKENTLCITIAANIADSGILTFDACFPDSVVGFQPCNELKGNIEYFLTFIETAKARLLEFAPSTAQKNINLAILDSVLIPIPPKDEMTKIVNILNIYDQQCDALKSLLIKQIEVSKLLTTVVVNSFTGLTAFDEEKPMKTPKTELAVSVVLGTIFPAKKESAPLASLVSRANGEIQAKDLWQHSGMDIDTFYAQLKTEVAHGWIAEPEEAVMNVLGESDNND